MSALDLSNWSPEVYSRIAVIGAGAWGTALAATAARAGRHVTLYGRDAETIAEINAERHNSKYLPDQLLPEGIRATTDLADAVSGVDAILLVTPSSTIRPMCRALGAVAPATAPVILCAKGVEAGTGLLMSQIAEQEMRGQPIGALSGPTFAVEVAAELPTAATIASPMPADDPTAIERSVAARMALALSSGSFRAYVSDDLVGMEMAGAMKNVIAIACGVARGAGFQANMQAAMITRGLAEIMTMAEAMGGRRDTAAGLSGLGDLSLTCSSEKSRNLRFGLQLGAGLKPEETFGGAPVVVEGARNAISVTDLARAKHVKLPICEAVRAIVHDGADVVRAIGDLWAQPIEAESHLIDLSIAHPNAAQVHSKFEELAG